MRPISSFFLFSFFLFNLPIVIFMATILYGGLSSSVIKEELAKAQIYDAMTKHLQESFQGDEESSTGAEDPSSALIMSVLQEKLTPSYMQEKTELFIDDTGKWMQGKTQTPPVISFKEIKEDVLAQNPTLFTDIEKAIEEAKKQQEEMKNDPSYAEYASSEENGSIEDQTKAIQTFVKSDFSIPVGKNMQGVKDGYDNLKIAFPVLIVLLLASLAGMVFLNSSTSSRLRWIAITLCLTGVYGFLIILLNSFILNLSKEFFLEQQNSLTNSLSPILTQMMHLFFAKYKEYQMLVTNSFIVVGAVLFIISFVLKHDQPIIQKPAVLRKKK